MDKELVDLGDRRHFPKQIDLNGNGKADATDPSSYKSASPGVPPGVYDGRGGSHAQAAVSSGNPKSLYAAHQAIEISPKLKPTYYYKAHKRPIEEILGDLAQPIPARFIRHKLIKGTKIKYVRWTDLNRILDYFAPGWEWKIQPTFDGTQVCVVGELTLHAAEGSFTRCAVGDEDSEVDTYGSSWTNAEAQAFRRACARWGLGLHLWG